MLSTCKKRCAPMLALGALVLAGCAQDPAPNAQLVLTEQAFAQATAVGAEPSNHAYAEAEAKLAQAKKNMAEADYKRARMLAEQAELDARLSALEVLKQQTSEQLKVLEDSITQIKQQLGSGQ